MKPTSQEIARAYLSWAKNVHDKVPHEADEIVINNLSDVHLVDKTIPDLQIAHIFSNVISDTEFTDSNTRQKVQQSLNYLKFRNEKPTAANLAQTGAIFVDVTPADIEYFRSKVTQRYSAFNSNLTSVEFIENTGQEGIKALNDLLQGTQAITWGATLMPEYGTFDAKVVTDAEGRLVTSFPKDVLPGPTLAATVFHEVVGHVFHFSHLRLNQALQQFYPHLLCVCPHTHESFFIEGIAQLLVLLILERGKGITNQAEIKSRAYGWALNMALSHCNLRSIFEGQRSINEAVDFHLKHDNTGRHSAESIQAHYKESASSLFACKKTLNYFSSLKTVMPLLNLDQKVINSFMPELLSSYFTPDALREFVGQKA